LSKSVSTEHPDALAKSIGLESLELRIAVLLRNGVLLAGGLMFLGWMALLQFRQNPFLEAQVYRQSRFTERLTSLLQDPLGSRETIGTLICYAGLILLISLPILRVGMTAILFFRQRDRLLGWIAVIVLAILGFSFILGIEL
jgi:uncharacterized membrane protein